MPRRKVIFANGSYYHVFSRSLFRQPIFESKRDCDYFLEAVAYYRLAETPIQFSKYLKSKRLYKLNYNRLLVKLMGFTLMPNHFHFVVRQEEERGIHVCMRRLLNSYSRFFGTKYARRGPLFESMFQAVLIETEEQLMHVLRYVDINATTSYLVEDPGLYNLSSYNTHVGKRQYDWVDNEFILARFGSHARYESFVRDNIDYQRKLKEIEHLLLEGASGI